ncbi:Tyrosine-protein phosphatase non-receptor type 13 [Pseudolycoriella hygida]|uniref:Tyrosine-protein phosphatase non-receptor type 13 n=1 Tax=Pseudolycoriella hygida TaxID=35572 RepID=A0A9Q0MVW7_9DIPT|nr:Tyrosine-protein phosphatase non-receptor type 13 [Pseudolycoriella hygida]
MDLFQEAVDKSEMFSSNKNSPSFDNRSDTDSGNSSAQGDRDIYAIYNHESDRKIQTSEKRALKVSRASTDDYKHAIDAPFIKFNAIGCPMPSEMEEKPLEPSKRLQVTRRRDEILKRRNRSRRNTIAVNLLDVTKDNLSHTNDSWDGYESKSSNCIDKIGDIEENGLAKKINDMKNGSSMPELNGTKFSTLPNLKVRRTKEILSSNENINHSLIIKSKGPEFIANSSLSPRAIDITDTKCQHNKRALIVLLLNGKSIKITCNPATATAQEIFETVVKCENFTENFFLGICALNGGDFVFLPPDLKIHKVAPEIWFNPSKKGSYTENVIFTLFLRTKFFLPTLRGISHILCNDDELISLGGLALQSEIGDFTESMKHADYFTISHYLPEGVYQRNMAMGKYLRNSHYSKKGLQSREAEYNFIRYVQEMKEYGLHLFSAVWTADDDLPYDVYVAVSLSGIQIFKRSSTSRQDEPSGNAKHSKTEYQRKLYANFEWLEIENLCFSKHILCVVIRRSESLKAKDNNRVKYKLRMDGRKSYFAFHLASEHHRFYMKLRNSFISLKALSDELNFPLKTTMVSTADQGHMEAGIDDFQQNYVNMEQPNPIELVNKPDKTGESRVGKLKKSMLNDNRLLKLRNKFLKRSKSSVSKERICLNPNGQSKEENQNKENECPKIELKSQLLSPNRNRVKMGTRVFSAQFLNKSFDNVSDSNGFNMYRFDSNGYLNQDSHRGKTCNLGQCEQDFSDDGMSLTSTSLSSLYYSEKMSEKFAPSPLPTEAYVIQSNMKSNCDINQFSMFNESISDSLLEKFNNLSNNNTIGDRVISRITIVKDSFAQINSNNGGVFSLDSDGNSSTEDNYVAGKWTLGISIVQGSDKNVYVKDLVKNGPGERGGVQIGDQILAVNGRSLLNLSYDQSLKMLQNTDSTVELTLSQIYKKPITAKQVSNVQPTKVSTVRNITRSMKNSFKFKKDRKDIETGKSNINHVQKTKENYQKHVDSCDIAVRNYKNGNEKAAIRVRSTPDLPKVVGTIPKHPVTDKGTHPRAMGLSRKYVGPVRYPVTPVRPTNSAEKHRLSLLADNVDKQVFI